MWFYGKLSELPEESKREAADMIARDLLRQREGDIYDPETWQELCESIGVVYAPFYIKGGHRGEYKVAKFGEDHAGIIAVNEAYSPKMQARIWVHEVAHHKLHVWCPPQLTEAADSHAYEGEPDDVRHQIAQIVETLVFDLYGSKE